MEADRNFLAGVGIAVGEEHPFSSQWAVADGPVDHHPAVDSADSEVEVSAAAERAAVGNLSSI